MLPASFRAAGAARSQRPGPERIERGHDVRVVTLARAVGRTVVAALAVAVAASCGTSGTSTRTESGSLVRSRTGSIYLTREADEWKLHEARNPRPGGPLAQVEPSLDWYAEYERSPDARRAIRVRLSGHAVASGMLQQELKGFTFATAGGASWPALPGRPSDPTGPQVILFAVADDYTVMALSYELGPNEMIEWSHSLKPAEESTWVTRGGVVEP